MAYQPVPPPLDQLTIDSIESALDTIIGTLEPMGVNLTKPERSAAKSIADERLPFAVDYYTNKNDYPNLKPQFMDETQADTHWFISYQTGNAEFKVKKVIELLSDLRINSEHHAIKYALEGYNVVGRAKDQNVPGADTFYDLLSSHFEKSPSTPPPVDEEPTP